jgi:hypothetical protein
VVALVPIAVLVPAVLVFILPPMPLTPATFLKVWIITEADPSVTTFLLPDEY